MDSNNFNNNKNNNKYYEENPLDIGRIIAIILAFAFFWPAGIYLLIRTIREVEDYNLNRYKRTGSSNTEFAGYKRTGAGNTTAKTGSTEPQIRTAKFTQEKVDVKNSKLGSLATKVKEKFTKIFGYVGMGLGGITLLGTLIDFFDIGIFDFGGFLISGVFLGLGAGMLVLNSAMRKKLKRYKKYRAIIGSADAMSISAIAAKVPTTFDKACADLEDMISEGYFGPDAYLDMATYNFLRSQNAEPIVEKPVEDTFQEFTEDYQGIITKIRTLNDSIKDEDVSNKISRIEDVTSKIFRILGERPQKKQLLRTFLNYYLPTTLKLLDDYRMLEAQGVAGEHIERSKADIERILDTLVLAFEQQLDALFEDDALDISSEIDALETMMAKDFATGENPFAKPKTALEAQPQPQPQPSEEARPFDAASGASALEDEVDKM